MGSKSRSRWYLVASLLLAGVLLVLTFRGVAVNDMLTVLRQGRLDLILLAFVTLSVSYFVRGLRWRVLMSAEKHLPHIMVFWATMIGYLGNNLLPARAGEVIRAAALGRKANISKGFVLGIIFAERGIDVVALVLISAISIVALEDSPDWLPNAVLLATVLGLVAVVGLFLTTRFESVFLKTIGRFPLPGVLRTKAASLIPRFLLGIRAFQHPGRALSLVAFTVVVWLLDGAMAIEVARALNLTLDLPQALLLLAALALASTVPLTPGYVGVYQFVAVTVLVPFSFLESEALAYIIALQALAYSVVLTLGFVGVWQLAIWGETISYGGWFKWIHKLRKSNI